MTSRGEATGCPAWHVTAPVIRPALPSDLPALGDFFAGLSVQSRYLRFFSPITPGPALLAVLCGSNGTGTTDAVLAIRDGVIIGHAMAVDRSGPCGDLATDVGVVVADAWQRQGIGSALMRAVIAGAQVRGATSVTMDVLHGNDGVVAMIRRGWPAARSHRAKDYNTLCIPLAPVIESAADNVRVDVRGQVGSVDEEFLENALRR